MPRTELSPLLLLPLVACSSTPERNPLPEALAGVATIPGIPRARYWADEAPEATREWMDLSEEELRERYPATFGTRHEYLAISGGGPRGAFGAGLLQGWSETGTRPEFTMVTGVSTGALIAPFAFLGPEYDHVLETFYTQYSTEDIVEPRSALGTLFGDAAADSAPLRAKLEHFVSDEVVEKIAAESARGRALVIVTTNLDAGRSVAWDVDRIAASGHPRAGELIRDIMLASASIPGAFPPVMFDVEAEGQLYDELHVDGGATSVVHLYPLGLDWDALLDRFQVDEKPNVYLLRNGFLDNDWAGVERSTIDITIKTIDTLMGSVVMGDIYRIYLTALRDGLSFHMAYVPESFDFPSKEPFDRDFMVALFQLGYEQGRAGYEWSSTPPGYDVD